MTACVLTLGNLLCGLGAILLAVQGFAHEPAYFRPVPPEVVQGVWLLFLGMLLDAFDGRVARWTKSDGPFGAELDSLADMVSFGLAPAVLAWTVGVRAGLPSWMLWGAASAYAACAAVRLARYNVLAQTRKSKTSDFTGLPSPAAAGLIAGILLLGGVDDLDPQLRERALVLAPLVLLGAGFLMVSRIPYLHVPNRLGRTPLTGLLALALVVILALYPALTLSTAFFGYALAGLSTWALGRLLPRPEADEDAFAEERTFRR